MRGSRTSGGSQHEGGTWGRWNAPSPALPISAAQKGPLTLRQRFCPALPINNITQRTENNLSAQLSLDEIRKKIDEIDSELLRLLNDRADLVHEVGLIKKEAGLSIYAPEREESLLQRLVQKSKRRLPETAIRANYRGIMSASFALEKELCIGFLRPEATWTHQAARSKFGASVRYSPQSSISDVFDRVTRTAADYGVVPIE